MHEIITEVVSQPGRFLNDFRHLGFNQAENGRKVFDAMMQWIAAGDGINLNYRFSQPGRTEFRVSFPAYTPPGIVSGPPGA